MSTDPEREPDYVLADAEKLTLLQIIGMLTAHESRSVLIQLEGAPCRVRVTLEFPRS